MKLKNISMSKRDVVKMVIAGEAPPYVPWAITWTSEARKKLAEYYRIEPEAIEEAYGEHFIRMGNNFESFYFKSIGGNLFKDPFGVVWHNSGEEGMGTVEGIMLERPTLKGYKFPDPDNPGIYKDLAEGIKNSNGRLRQFVLPFLLFMRSSFLRGMQNHMMDFYDNPGFVHDLYTQITDYNIAQVLNACEYDIDVVYMGDDWGQQVNLIMGPQIWREFIKPQVKRLYQVVKEMGKIVYIHSCGDIQDILPDLIEMGVQVYNPFQPEVMNVSEVFGKHHRQLTFHGGLSNQNTMPSGSVEDVRANTKKLLKMGQKGSYIFSPSNCVTSNTPLENMLVMITTLKEQPGYRANSPMG